nr:hypothetical protein [uncultured Leptotrichia sp.]
MNLLDKIKQNPEEISFDEVIAYITSQDNPALHQKVKIKKNAWHTFQIDLKLAGGKYFATWLIDDVKCAAQQLTYGQEHPFYIFCSTENLKFVGDSWPYKDNYGLWDYVTYTPYPYSMEPIEPQNQLNPPDPEPEPTTIQKSYSEAYSATGKIHLRQQAENQKEHVICLAFLYSQKVVMHVNALRR